MAICMSMLEAATILVALHIGCCTNRESSCSRHKNIKIYCVLTPRGVRTVLRTANQHCLDVACKHPRSWFLRSWCSCSWILICILWNEPGFVLS